MLALTIKDIERGEKRTDMVLSGGLQTVGNAKPAVTTVVSPIQFAPPQKIPALLRQCPRIHIRTLLDCERKFSGHNI
jgi:hypothetical protein